MTRDAENSELKSTFNSFPSPSWNEAMAKVGMEKENGGRGPTIWVSNTLVNERCPQKVIKFYEGHVRFANLSSSILIVRNVDLGKC